MPVYIQAVRYSGCWADSNGATTMHNSAPSFDLVLILVLLLGRPRPRASPAQEGGVAVGRPEDGHDLLPGPEIMLVHNSTAGSFARQASKGNTVVAATHRNGRQKTIFQRPQAHGSSQFLVPNRLDVFLHDHGRETWPWSARGYPVVSAAYVRLVGETVHDMDHACTWQLGLALLQRAATDGLEVPAEGCILAGVGCVVEKLRSPA